MANLMYKDFVWPQDPEVYQENAIWEPKYHTEDGITYFDGMGDMKRIITGSGIFSGELAYDRFRRLQALMEEGGAGNLQHPEWGIRYCYFTGLELVQQPRENVVSYKFEFTQALGNGVVPK